MRSKKVLAIVLATTLMVTPATTNIYAYGETSDSSTLLGDTQNIQEYQDWKSSTWTGNESTDSSKMVLTPGVTEKSLNFAWYSETKGNPAVKIGKKSDLSDGKEFDGIATSIDRTNGTTTYKASNKVTIDNYFEENTTYYYSYTDNKTGNWSEIYQYTTKGSESFQAVLVGDPQIGASGSNGQGTADDLNIAVDTYNWNKTLNQVAKTAKNASFILSAGDQIDYSNIDTSDTKGIRESEYAGFTYPALLRNLPVATTIGNHESKGTDYKYHYNNPNSLDNLGSTNSGSDYYFSYGDTLIISMNSNNRNTVEHDELLKKAIASNPNAKWKVVMFHHDIYGSGQPHSDTDGANLRILFAPLMDKYDIDVCLTGHDHSYARTYLLSDGTAIQYNDSVAVNPEGTLYIAAGSASGSKFYKLATTKQYYIAERSNTQVPTFSTIDFTNDSLTIKTYDYNGNKYADDYTLYKTEKNETVEDVVTKAEGLKKNDYTSSTWSVLETALTNVKNLMKFTEEDAGAKQLSSVYDKTNDANNENDMLDYYGYAQKNYADAVAGTTKLKAGFSTLLDKTMEDKITINNKTFTTQYNNLVSAIAGLEKAEGTTEKPTKAPTKEPTTTKKPSTDTKLSVKIGKKSIKAKKSVTIKAGKSIQIKVKVDGKTKKVTYKTGNKKIATISKSGKIKAIKKSAKKVKITVTYKKKKFTFYVKVK